jgi:hypothetical protein
VAVRAQPLPFLQARRRLLRILGQQGIGDLRDGRDR